MRAPSEREKEARFFRGAIAFVVAVRLVFEAVGFVIAAPIKRLAGCVPDTGRSAFPRLGRLKVWVVNRTAGWLPEWVEYNGNFTFLVNES